MAELLGQLICVRFEISMTSPKIIRTTFLTICEFYLQQIKSDGCMMNFISHTQNKKESCHSNL